jgi:hypothetical protein
VRHEATHWIMRHASHQPPTILAEGLAVTVAGGHYRPENMVVRAAALLALDEYVPLADLTSNFRRYQHERAYIEAAGLTAFLIETYGWSEYLDFYRANIRESSNVAWLEAALARKFGTSLASVEADYIAWLESQPVTESDVTDVRLTARLYGTMRRYQAQFAPYQEHLPEFEPAFENNLTAPFIREATAPENLALEALLINAHQAHREGRFDECEALLDALNATLDDGDFSREPVSDYDSLARLVGELGYQLQRVEFAGDEARVEGIKNWPQIETITFARFGSEWQFVR